VAMTEIAETMQEGLLALAVGAGLQVMAALMEADVTALAGRRGACCGGLESRGELARMLVGVSAT
jgi:hypothetical protein